jgi:hypothetical protein
MIVAAAWIPVYEAKTEPHFTAEGKRMFSNAYASGKFVPRFVEYQSHGHTLN